MKLVALLMLSTCGAGVPLRAATEALGSNLRVIAYDANVADRAVAAMETALDRFEKIGRPLSAPHLPILVVAVPTVIELAPYVPFPGLGPGRTRAVSFVGSDRNYVVLAWEAAGPPETALVHELAHLTDPDRTAPAWFREGLAEYLAHLEPDERGDLRPRTSRAHLARLAAAEWLPSEVWLNATAASPAFQAPTFYAQSWLAVRWLASRGAALGELSAALFEAERRRLGDEALTSELRRYGEELGAALAAERSPARQPAGDVGPTRPFREIDDWEWRFWHAELHRGLHHHQQAGELLESLAVGRPAQPLTEAALGALAMDQGRYDEAEQRLAAAVSSPDAEPRTHHRYALMLLRPSRDDAAVRALNAARHAALALEAAAAPAYRLTLAQARMVAGEWDAAASLLRALASDPAWRGRADREFAELERRRQQALRQIERPAVTAAARTPSLPEPDPPAIAPPPDPTEPAPPRRPSWPPPGAWIAAGQIASVDCSGPEKIISIKHPLFSMRFREPKGRPARLHLPPDKSWTEIPCGKPGSGWLVNLAYRPAEKPGPIRGDALAIHF